MAIPHALPGQPVDVGPLGSRLATERTTALFKANDLEVMRLVLVAGKSLPPHKVPGEITIHCIEGRLEVTADGASHVLGAGQLLYLPGDVVHAVRAVEDSSGLVTVALKSWRMAHTVQQQESGNKGTFFITDAGGARMADATIRDVLG